MNSEDKRCIGCKSLITSFKRVNSDITDGHECRYTGCGSRSIEGCPCKQCVIKIMCATPCQDFIDIMNDLAKIDGGWWVMARNMIEKNTK